MEENSEMAIRWDSERRWGHCSYIAISEWATEGWGLHYDGESIVFLAFAVCLIQSLQKLGFFVFSFIFPSSQTLDIGFIYSWPSWLCSKAAQLLRGSIRWVDCGERSKVEAWNAGHTLVWHLWVFLLFAPSLSEIPPLSFLCLYPPLSSVLDKVSFMYTKLARNS